MISNSCLTLEEWWTWMEPLAVLQKHIRYVEIKCRHYSDVQATPLGTPDIILLALLTGWRRLILFCFQIMDHILPLKIFGVWCCHEHVRFVKPVSSVIRSLLSFATAFCFAYPSTVNGFLKLNKKINILKVRPLKSREWFRHDLRWSVIKM